MECVLQGVIESKHVSALENLVRGMTGAPPVATNTHERIFHNLPTIGPPGCELRLSCPYDPCRPAAPASQWTIVHEGGAMRGAGAEQLQALVRSVVRVDASAGALRLLTAMGMRQQHEYLRNGNTFAFKHRGFPLVLVVVSISAVPDARAADEGNEQEACGEGPHPLSALRLVELTSPATADNYTAVCAAVLSFSETLSPLVRMAKPGIPAGIPPSAAAAAAAIAPAHQAQ